MPTSTCKSRVAPPAPAPDVLPLTSTDLTVPLGDTSASAFTLPLKFMARAISGYCGVRRFTILRVVSVWSCWANREPFLGGTPCPKCPFWLRRTQHRVASPTISALKSRALGIALACGHTRSRLIPSNIAAIISSWGAKGVKRQAGGSMSLRRDRPIGIRG